MRNVLSLLGIHPSRTLPAKRIVRPKDASSLGRWNSLLVIGGPREARYRKKVSPLALLLQAELADNRAVVWIDDPEQSHLSTATQITEQVQGASPLNSVLPDEEGYYPDLSTLTSPRSLALLAACLQQAPNNRLQDRTLNSVLAKLLLQVPDDKTPLTLVLHGEQSYIRETLLLSLLTHAGERNIRVVTWVGSAFKPARLLNELARRADAVVGEKVRASAVKQELAQPLLT